MKRHTRLMLIMGIVIIAGTPFFSVSADHTTTHSIQQLQDQAADLQARIKVLQEKLRTEGISAPAPPLQFPVSPLCPEFSHSLFQGTSDRSTEGEVTKLQKILAEDQDVYPEGLITGYYGNLTEKAVKRWQAKQGVVSSGTPATTGFGVVGPQTRSRLTIACLNPTAPPPKPLYDPNTFSQPTAPTVPPPDPLYDPNTFSQPTDPTVPPPDPLYDPNTFSQPTAPTVPPPDPLYDPNTFSQPTDPTTKDTTPPTITIISPTSGPLGTTVTLTGSGFTPTGNTVDYGFGQATNVTALFASDGDKITFTAKATSVCFGGICNSPAFTLGPYNVLVTNVNGTSNRMTFTLTDTEIGALKNR